MKPPSPIDDRTCLWTTSGIAAHHACDRDFACEECPFDSTLRSKRPLECADADLASLRGATLCFPEDRSYHPGHVWTRQEADGNWRVGLDAFAAGLLRGASSAIVPPTGARLSRGRVGFWVTEESDTVSLLSPVSGTVTATNHALAADPRRIVEDPYSEGWLVSVRRDSCEPGGAALLDAPEMRRKALSELRDLRRAAARFSHEASEGLGTTLPDGGFRLRDFREILGPRRYHGLLSKCLR